MHESTKTRERETKKRGVGVRSTKIRDLIHGNFSKKKKKNYLNDYFKRVWKMKTFRVVLKILTKFYKINKLYDEVFTLIFFKTNKKW